MVTYRESYPGCRSCRGNYYVTNTKAVNASSSHNPLRAISLVTNFQLRHFLSPRDYGPSINRNKGISLLALFASSWTIKEVIA